MRSKVMGRASLCLVWQITLPLLAYPGIVQQVCITFFNDMVFVTLIMPGARFIDFYY